MTILDLLLAACGALAGLVLLCCLLAAGLRQTERRVDHEHGMPPPEPWR